MESDLLNSRDEWSPVRTHALVKNRRTVALGDLHVLPDETLCTILTKLAPHDIGRLACVSSVMYILCNEEPLWMGMCLSILNHELEYKGSWKKTALHQLGLHDKYYEACKPNLHFEGFSSSFLYRRLYRCYTSLKGFSFDDGNVERRKNISLEEFHEEYDGKKPVMIDGLADNWPARKSWTSEQFLIKYSDAKFRISQKSSKKVNIKFKDYITYMQVQHDEDPLYIFDDKFGEVAPDMLKDYSIPHLFQEDYFDVLDMDKRPPFRWLIIGPERSGASWHVDPGLTSAWNTLICGRKRWALYPPGRVPLGVTVHVNEDDGDVNIDTPSSLQWWLDFYPLLGDNDRPIECTQLPGETIYVPSGWWHCVLNLETTIAVTQNFVNSKNFEFVCLDMTPGYRHKGVCRAGWLAIDDDDFEAIRNKSLPSKNNLSYSDLSRKEKRIRICQSLENIGSDNGSNETPKSDSSVDLEYSYDIDFLAMFLDNERGHYTSLWSSGNIIGQREMRDWLWKLWIGRPGLRDLIWKGACLALNAGKWYDRVEAICVFHELPSPLHDEKLPVGTGSNPVYLIGDYVVKIFAEGGLEASLYGLGTELEFQNLLNHQNSSLKNCIPSVLESGILVSENGSYRVFPWDGRGIPEVIASSNLISVNQTDVDYPFGVLGKKQFEYQNAGKPLHNSGDCSKSSFMWPYIVTKRCRGRIFADLRDTLPLENVLNLASFLGEQLHNLHVLPVPCPSHGNGNANKIDHSAEWKLFIMTLNQKRKGVMRRLSEWGDPIPGNLIEKVDEYIPHDLTMLFNIFENDTEVLKSWTWIHSDVMDDNIYMTPCPAASLSGKCNESRLAENPLVADSNHHRENDTWSPSHILDFSDLTIGEPILDLIPLYLDVFRGDSHLLKQFLKSYKLPLMRKTSSAKVVEGKRFGQLSYRAMCYCILHEENVLGAIFSLWKELRTATSWEEVEEKVWGDLNNYSGFC
ncbi:bifunctional arginine demethylase andlysyl-hydroxylase JMJD6 [Striga asiatica]|uniref:Bifunctional arginine demethylase andlysyl-hydroxylase JMJD6 n=1 Tax=Striga asiatica TaxID=4170 RepID=A0A5A7Q4V8_STRAF|nr:bifunctional arginine demethylase andlysyl-hydroxylase JMJD6 [Striga asiatica]